MDDSSDETIARYQALFDHCQEAIIFFTHQAVVLDANQAWLDLLRYGREEISGLDASRLLCGDSEALLRFQGDIERHGSVEDYDIQLQRKDGKQIDCLVNATTWPERGGLRGYMVMVRDAPAQKETERALSCLLRMSDDLNSAADLDDLLDLLVVQLLELTDAESGCAGLRTSQGMECSHFLQPNTIIPMAYHCAPGVGWAGWLIDHGRYYLTNDAGHDPVIVQEVRKRFSVKSGIAVPILDSERDVIGFIEVYNKTTGDFTSADLDHSLAAAQIATHAIHNRLLQRNLSALVTFSSSLTATSDFDEVLEVVGRHLEANFKRRSVIFLPLNGGLSPRFRSADFVLNDVEFAAAKWSWEHGEDAGHSTEILSSTSAHYLPLKARGEVIGVLGLEAKPEAWFSNVQRQLFKAFVSQSALAIERGLLEHKMRRLRFLEESDKVQNAVLSAISHDVRAPLAAITASLSGLLTSHGALDQAAERQLLDTADIEARRLHRLVNNLLSMTRLETGTSRLKTEPHDLLDVVSAALEELGAAAHQRQVSFHIPDDLPLVSMDFALITHVFINLFSNAFKYSPPDHPIEVRGRIINDHLEVLVVDRGVGVPQQELSRIFDKFYRASEFGSHSGLGLGLAICKAFIEAHGGRITLENNPLGGTIVRLVMPFTASALA
jgi:PAS domain S-box-containing protein